MSCNFAIEVLFCAVWQEYETVDWFLNSVHPPLCVKKMYSTDEYAQKFLSLLSIPYRFKTCLAYYTFISVTFTKSVDAKSAKNI